MHSASAIDAVWAPAASTVEIRAAATPFAMNSPAGETDVRACTPAERGYWDPPQGWVNPERPFYAVRIDGGPWRPDPRSRRQPLGVHGPSQLYAGAPVSPWAGCATAGAAIYELHVGTFTEQGTLNAAAEHLARLAAFGFDMVQLMPCASFNGTHGWGYDGVALFSVHEPYGGPDALHRFCEQAHTQGLGVCLDVVYNHLGPSGNYLPEFGPYFTARHVTPWGPGVNLDDDDCHGMREFILDNVRYWLTRFGVDALRLDAVHELKDTSAPHILADIARVAGEVADARGYPAGLIAESDLNDPAIITPTAAGGAGMTAQWNDDTHHALHAATSGERHGYYTDFGSMHTLAHTATNAFWHNGTWSPFRRRTWGHPISRERTRCTTMVTYSATHDQIGNRAAGDRPASHLDERVLAARAAWVLGAPTTAIVFMGQEWGATTPWAFFASHPEPALRDAIRTGRFTEFSAHGWDPETIADPMDDATRTSSIVRHETRDDTAPLVRWYQQLLAFRRHDPYRAGTVFADVHTTYSEAGGWCAFTTPSMRVVIWTSHAADTTHVPRVTPGMTREIAFGDIEEDGNHIACSGPGAYVATRFVVPDDALFWRQ